MSRVLLVDADGHHAKQVEWALRSISCQTTTCTDSQSATSLLQRQPFDTTVVVSSPGFDWDIRVEFIRHVAFRMPEPAPIVCLLRGPYRGPNERVYAARKGFSLLYDDKNQLNELMEEVDFLLAERRHLRARGPHFLITHWDRQLGTTCAAGEMIGDVAVSTRLGPVSLGLTHTESLLADCVFRYRRPLSALDIEEIMNSDPFYLSYASNRTRHSQWISRPDRRTAKIYFPRIRKRMEKVFGEIGLTTAADQVLVSECTESKVVFYRFKATYEVIHMPQ